uniref:Piwi domain-containing protein n=1 Tax=Acrobeloides nanus TaxID=290746 RepID=A0A914CB47_9BILA
MDAIQRKEYVTVGSNCLFEANDKQSVGQGMVLKSSLSQGVRITSNLKPALSIDVKKSVFYDAQPLLKSVQEVFKEYAHEENLIGVLNYLYEGVRVSVDYTKAARHFVIKNFTENAIKYKTFTYNDMEITIPEYYYARYKITLKHTNMPGVIPDISGKNLVYPLELLKVVENQRVSMEKIKSANLSSELHKANVVHPNIRFQRIDETMKKLGLIYAQNSYLDNFGVSIDPNSNKVEMTVLQKPTISMGNKEVTPDNKTHWRTKNLKYSKGVSIQKLAILCHTSLAEPPLKNSFSFQFAKELAMYAEGKGISLKQPILRPLNDERSLKEWVENFKYLAQTDTEFVLYIGSKKNTKKEGDAAGGFNPHARLKLFESLYKILTQHIATETIDDCTNKDTKGQIIQVRGQSFKDISTVENILNKLNVKNSGINYKPIIEPSAKEFALEDGNVLVISYDVAHPPPVSDRMRRYLPEEFRNLMSVEPSVVGFVGNVDEDPHAFNGDFFYQESRRESVNHNYLKEETTWLLGLLQKNRPDKCKPAYIFVIRDGISEGQYLMALEEELKTIKQAFYEFDPSYKPKFVMIISTKDHNKRFGKLEGQKVVNAEPGTVVDTKYNRADCLEFFMLAHHPLQGTAKFVEYAILFDEIGITTRLAELFLLYLCYQHQITPSAIAIPASVKQADELAKRGMNVYNEFKKDYDELK